MYLKFIEIQGFKSFADKTQLNFKNGITGVVGPNGSGKSNITDAVRWVLGEQSIKTLRGGKMEDVIFAGTQFRKPVGLAQVSLVLDNADGKIPIDYNEVKITRRLYRKGDSEYYINNTQCRLKDIQELFMDTGIGKEGYSIIGQGKIDAVLSGKPEERRSLLEEAAGIVKFKWRKEESEKKLSNTEQNLTRINDIISTYEDRIEPLRIENEKANKFIAYSDELNKKEINIIIDSLDKIKSKSSINSDEIQKVYEQTNSLLEEKENLKKRSKSLDEELGKLESLLGSKKQEYYENKDKHQTLLAECSLLTEKIENAKTSISRNNENLSELTDKLEDNKVEIEKNSEFKVSVETELKTLENSIQALESDIKSVNESISESAVLSEKLKGDKIELLNVISDHKNDVSVLKNTIEINEDKIYSLKGSCDSYKSSIKINVSTKGILNNSIDKINNKIASLEGKLAFLKEEIKKANGNLEEQEKEFRRLNVELNKSEANRNMLINLDKHYEGYNKSVKALMQHIEDKKVDYAKDKCFVLGEVLNVPKGLELSVEVSLGSAISNIITDNESIAKRLIEYLKTNNIGRATFLPLNILKSNKISLRSEINLTPGVKGVLSDLVEFNDKYKNAIEFVLGRTVLCDTMETALLAAKKMNYSCRIVTLSGEIINPGGSLTGGSIYQKSMSIIGRKREIQELNDNIINIKEKIKNSTDEIQLSKNLLKELNEDSININEEIHVQNIEITKTQGKLAAIDADCKKLQDNLNISLMEVKDLEDKLLKSKKNLIDREKSIEELLKSSEEIDEKIDDIQENLKNINISLSNKNTSLTEFKVQKAQKLEMYANYQKENNRLTSLYNEYTEKLNATKEEIEKTEFDKLSLENKYSENITIIQNIIGEIERIKESFEKHEIQIGKIKENILSNSSALEESVLLIQNKEEEKHRLEIIKTRLETEGASLYQKLNDELNLTYAEALDYKVHIDDIGKWKEDIVKLKASITELGVVNLGAIEEYKETTEKYNFMCGQREDLVNAMRELNDVIKEMTERMEELFSTNFQLLRKNFNETFKELFNGGSADLKLSEGDILTSNIEINVEPPGKKLQNINLMSGGEKVLSAIALLFAILKMKPTPFCILDEIEAALDDANVYRYAEFLRKFSDTTQFIVITHRKGTMGVSDILYGVTMEEKGISKIVSVDLTE